MPDRKQNRSRNRAGVVAAAAVAITLLSASPAAALPVANSDLSYTVLGRVFPDPLAGCQHLSAPPCSPHAQGNLPALQFLQFPEFEGALAYMNTRPQWQRYMEVWPLATGEFAGNDLGRLEFEPSEEYRSAGVPTTDLNRKKSDLYVVRVTDESVPDEGKKRFTLSLSIHGIERAGAEGGTRAMEDLVTAFTTGKADDPIVPDSVDASPPTFADVLRESIVYFTFPNPDGWRRGDITEGGAFFQRYNGNGVDPNRDWPDIGFSFRPYSGQSEPETRAFAHFYEDVEQRGGQFAAGDDLHGQPFADALSYTLLPHGRHDYAKDQRIREAAEAIHNASEAALSWSPIIQPSDAPRGGGLPCVETLGSTCLQLYGQTWGTVYDTINYTTTGTLGDWFDSNAGLGADGIDNEMSFSHLDRNVIFDPHGEQLHVDGNKALIYAHLAKIINPPPEPSFEAAGDKGYVANPRLTRAERVNQGDGGEAQASIAMGPKPQTAPETIYGAADGFEVNPGNGGMRVEATHANVQGIGPGYVPVVNQVRLRIECRGCDSHAHAPGEEESEDWVLVAQDFNQAQLYLAAGLTATVNLPQATKPDGSPVEWRAVIDGIHGASKVEIEFTDGPASTDGNTGGDDPPRLAAYDVANTDFFEDLDRFSRPGEGFDPVAPRQVLDGTRDLATLDTLVLADEALPADHSGVYSSAEKDAWMGKLRQFVAGGGNLVLTDGALLALPDLVTGIERTDVAEQTVYVGQVAFSDGVTDTTGDPLAEGVVLPGARFNDGMRRQTFEPTPLGFAIQDPSGGDGSYSPQYDVERAAWEAAGGRYVAGSADSAARDAQAVYDRVTIGELELGQGRIRIIGSLLPQPSQDFDHPLGIEPYAVTYTGYALAGNLLDWEAPNQASGSTPAGSSPPASNPGPGASAKPAKSCKKKRKAAGKRCKKKKKKKKGKRKRR